MKEYKNVNDKVMKTCGGRTELGGFRLRNLTTI